MAKFFQKIVPVRFSERRLATVEQSVALSQSGRIKYKNISWKAQFEGVDRQAVANPGELVVVTGRQGITLLVAPLGDVLCVSHSFP
jgi:membrane protein implicated in regulation of membrane protease activity